MNQRAARGRACVARTGVSRLRNVGDPLGAGRTGGPVGARQVQAGGAHAAGGGTEAPAAGEFTAEADDGMLGRQDAAPVRGERRALVEVLDGEELRGHSPSGGSRAIRNAFQSTQRTDRISLREPRGPYRQACYRLL